jgi:hypothetical protein
MNQIAISPAGEFTMDGANFVIDVAPAERRLSDSTAFTIVKSEFYLRFYEQIAVSFSPRSILELGIFQGGSYVFFDKLFKPQRISAVELSREPIAPLLSYCQEQPNRFVHFGISQSDRNELGRIVRDELSNELDLVIDDASHSYAHTKASFEFLFPLLSADGLYVIEDWSWAHAERYQPPDGLAVNQPALTNLLFEQIMLLGSTNAIAEIRVSRPLYLLRKGRTQMNTDDSSIFDQILNRGKNWTPI